MRVVDAHVHVNREEWFGGWWWDALAREAARLLDVPAEMVRETVVPAYFDEDGSDQLAAMDQAGVDVAVAFPYDWTRASGLDPAPVGWREMNDWYERFEREHPGRVRWGFGADPRHDGALESCRAALERGAAAVKIHPSAGFPLNDPIVDPFVEAARNHNVPVVFHVGPEPDPLDSSLSEPALLADVASRFDDVPMLAAHCGGERWRETVAVARDHPNVSVDLSGWQLRFGLDAPSFYRDVREVLDALRAERVLWGTDPPFYRPVVPDTMWVAAFADAPEGTFSGAEVEAIVGGNAAAFYRLG